MGTVTMFAGLSAASFVLLINIFGNLFGGSEEGQDTYGYVYPMEELPPGRVSCDDPHICDESRRGKQACGVKPLGPDDCAKVHCPPRAQIIVFRDACAACANENITDYYPTCPQ